MPHLKFLSTFILALGIGTFVSSFSRAQTDPSGRIGRVEIMGSKQVDRIQIVETLGLRVGEVYSPAKASDGLNRLAETQAYRSIGVRYDPSSLNLKIFIELAPVLGTSLLRITGLENETFEANELHDDLKGVIGLAEGEVMNLDFLGEVKDRLTKRLMDRGFESPSIVMSFEGAPESEKRNLIATIDLGSRMKISSLGFKNFSPNDQRDFFKVIQQKYWDRGNPKDFEDEVELFRKIFSAPIDIVKGFSEGSDPSSGYFVLPVSVAMDWVAITESMQAWGQVLRNSRFFDVKLNANPVRKKDGTFEIVLELQKGKKYNIQTFGNTAFWERDLRARILDRPERLGVPFSLTESVSLVESLFKSAGYLNVKVDTRSIVNGEEKLIEFQINEGERFFLGEFSIEGIEDRDNAAPSLGISKWIEPLQSPFHKTYFDEVAVRSRQGVFLDHLKQRGFLQARILDLKFKEPDSSRVVGMDLTLQLGPRFTVGSVEVNGNILLTNAELETMVGVSPGDPANIETLKSTADSILSAYRKLGFLRVSIDLSEGKLFKIDLEKNLVDVNFQIQPGPQLFIASTSVIGNGDTKPRVIFRALNDRDLKTGAEWNPFAIRQAEQDLLGLGIFGSASFEAVGGRILSRPRFEGDGIEKQEKDLRVRVVETVPGSIEFGPGYRSELGLVGSFEFKYRNLGGWNRGVNLRAQVSRKILNYQFYEQRYSLTFLEPYFLNFPVRLRLNLGYEKDDQLVFSNGVPQKGFNSEETSFGLALEKEFNEHFRIVHRLYEVGLPRIFDVVEGTTVTRSSERYRISSLGTTLTLDFRNNFFNPSKGWYSQSSYDFAAPSLGGDRNAHFLVLRQNLNKYFAVGNDGAIFAIALLYARIMGLGDSTGIPENRRLVLGGRTSIRSLDEKSLRFDGDGVLSQESFEVKLEFRQPLILDLGIAFFWDLGEVKVLKILNSQERQTSGVKSGVGFGLRYSTPVGPIALDFAFDPDPEENQDPFRLQFSIGSF